MKILITGSSGYIGSNLKKRLEISNEEIMELNRLNNGEFIIKSKDKELISRDLFEFSSFVKDFGVETLVNLSASTSKNHSRNDLEDLVSANLEFAASLAMMSLNADVKKYIYITTYSTCVDDNFYSPQTLYAATKQAAEDLLTFFHYLNIEIEFLHLYDVYGPNQKHPRFLNLLLRAIASKSKFHMTKGEQQVNFVHVDDVCGAIIKRLSTKTELKPKHPEHFSVYSNEVMSLREVPLIILETLNLMHLSELIVIDREYREREIFKFNPKYPKVPDWEARVDFKEGIRKIWDFTR